MLYSKRMTSGFHTVAGKATTHVAARRRAALFFGSKI